MGEKVVEQLELDIYYKKGKEKSQVYEDAHDGYDYKKGRYSLRDFTVIGNGNIVTIQQFKSGKFKTSYETIKIKLIGIPFPIGKVLVHDEMSDPSPVNIGADNTIIVSKEFSKIQIMAKKTRSRIKNQKKS